jgi:hypothetical protein
MVEVVVVEVVVVVVVVIVVVVVFIIVVVNNPNSRTSFGPTSVLTCCLSGASPQRGAPVYFGYYKLSKNA